MAASPATRRGAFIDRDGVVNVRPRAHDYLRSAAQFRWLPRAKDAIAGLVRAEYTVIVVSNQRGIARRLLTEGALHDIERRMQQDLRALGAQIHGFYYCTHNLGDGCDCRKPAPGLLLRAAAEYEIDCTRSVMIGDEETDVEAGHRAGCKAVLIADDARATHAELVAADLATAVDRLLAWT